MKNNFSKDTSRDIINKKNSMLMIFSECSLVEVSSEMMLCIREDIPKEDNIDMKIQPREKEDNNSKLKIQVFNFSSNLLHSCFYYLEVY